MGFKDDPTGYLNNLSDVELMGLLDRVLKDPLYKRSKFTDLVRSIAYDFWFKENLSDKQREAVSMHIIKNF